MPFDVLSDAAMRKAKPRSTAYTLTDGRGLGLYISAAGARLWRLRYLFEGKPKYLTFGSYPSMTLAAARQERDRVRELVRDGRNTSEVLEAEVKSRKTQTKDTFDKIAREWHALRG